MANILGIWFFINVLVVLLIIIMSIDDDVNFSFVNPVVIHDNISVNWFGAWLLAIVCNIVLPVIAIPYWIYKICTVGR